jgi:hypothetical protein
MHYYQINICARKKTMRFYEFVSARYLKTPALSNTTADSITQFQKFAFIPDTVKRQRIQQLQAARIAHSANQALPKKHD